MNAQPDLVIPLMFNRAKVTLANFSYQAVARLRPGVTIATWRACWLSSRGNFRRRPASR
jgi:hypothetical protein